jgi:hypothetical protein
VLRATGTRKPQGSPTDFNAQYRAEIGGETVAQQGLAALRTQGRSLFANAGDATRRAYLGRNNAHLAEILVAPDSVQQIRALLEQGADAVPRRAGADGGSDRRCAVSAIADLIAAAAQRRGVDPRALTGIAQIESSLNPNARNPRSSAGGLFQFIDSTAQRYGLTNKFDAAASADAGARLAADNGSAIARALGRPATPGELYLAHQQGAGGALKLLRNPDAPAAAVVGEKAFSLNGGVPGMTAGQFAQKWTSKLDPTMGRSEAPAAGPAPGAQTPQAGTDLAQALPGAPW